MSKLERRAVDASWNTDALVAKLASLTTDEREDLLREVGIQFPPRAKTASSEAAPATRREALQIAAATVATVVLPIAVVPGRPDALDGMARDFMRDNPLLSYMQARELAETY